MQVAVMPEAQLRRAIFGEKPPFPTVVDNSMRSAFIACPRKWMYSFLHSLAPAAPNIHLHAGGAIAKGLEVARRSFYEQHKPEAEAKRDGLVALMQYYGPVELPPARSGDKSLDNCIAAYDSYMQRYRLGQDEAKPYITAEGKAMVEFTFGIPTEVRNPSTGDPILFAGRCDWIADMHNALWVVDEKSTTSLGETWAKKWPLHAQFPGYMKAARYYKYPVIGAIVRGIGLLKTKITHAGVILQPLEFMLERWWWQFNRDLERMVQAYEEDNYDWALDEHTCASYGGCAFTTLCESPEPARWLNQYRIRKWDPTAKDFGENLLQNPALKKQPNELLEIDLDELSK